MSADAFPIVLRFVADINYVPAMDPMFCEGLAARLYFGAGLVFTNDITQITNISAASPAVITLAGAVTWNTGDAVQVLLFNNTDSSVCHTLVGRRFTISKIDTTHFWLVDEVTGQPLDGSRLNWNASCVTANAGHILELATPYVNGQ